MPGAVKAFGVMMILGRRPPTRAYDTLQSITLQSRHTLEVADVGGAGMPAPGRATRRDRRPNMNASEVRPGRPARTRQPETGPPEARQPGTQGPEARPPGIPPAAIRPGRPSAALGHPIRVALLDLLAQRGTVTATEAARELGESSGACSFHLRQLERYGHVEEAEGRRGRVRPWRLAATPAAEPRDRQPEPHDQQPEPRDQQAEPEDRQAEPEDQEGAPPEPLEPGPGHPVVPGDEFRDLARELENEGYRRWLAGRETAPPGWRDEAFSAVVYLTPDELTEVAAAIRAVVDSVSARHTTPRPPERAMPVGVVARLFPLLPASSDG
jgi:DNA-binding transcriptional ArsR family regulator